MQIIISKVFFFINTLCEELDKHEHVRKSATLVPCGLTSSQNVHSSRWYWPQAAFLIIWHLYFSMESLQICFYYSLFLLFTNSTISVTWELFTAEVAFYKCIIKPNEHSRLHLQLKMIALWMKAFLSPHVRMMLPALTRLGDTDVTVLATLQEWIALRKVL